MLTPLRSEGEEVNLNSVQPFAILSASAANKSNIKRCQAACEAPDTASGSSHSQDATRLNSATLLSQPHQMPALNLGDNHGPDGSSSSPSGGSQCSAESSRPRRKRSSSATSPDPHSRPSLKARYADLANASGGASWPLPEGRPKPSPQKKARMTWCPALHRSFLQALTKLGLRNAVPKTIMQEMKVNALSRENVASHLQKYRLALKRQANLSEATMISEATWPLLEAAHFDHIASLDPPIIANRPTQQGAAASRSDVPARDAAGQAQQPARSSLPPMLPPKCMPLAASFKDAYNGPPAKTQALPFGFMLPPPNCDGEAVGVPVPAHMFPSSSAPTGAPVAMPAAPQGACEPSTTSGEDGDALQPLALPERPASLMPQGFNAERLRTRIAEAGHLLPGASACDAHGMCTVYVVEPASLQPQPGARFAAPARGAAMPGFLKQAQVPEAMVAVSLAAYQNADVATAAAGQPVRAASTGSASRKRLAAQDNEGTATPRKLRKRTLPRSDGAQLAGLGGFGSTDALDVLAEVAGQMADGSD